MGSLFYVETIHLMINVFPYLEQNKYCTSTRLLLVVITEIGIKTMINDHFKEQLSKSTEKQKPATLDKMYFASNLSVLTTFQC